MIITLIGLGLLVVGIALLIISKNVKFNSWKTEDRVDILQFVFTLFGAAIVFATGIAILVNVCTCDVEYQNTLHTRDMLEYRIEHMEDNITGNEMLYNDIVEFNNTLRAEKKWANSPWTSWFNNQDIAAIDYIELDGH